jgi:hypothetical protein
MPEITDAQHAEYRRYQQFGTPDEVDGKVKEAEKLKGENAGLREKKRALEAKVPAEGATVLTGEEAKQYDAFKALNKTPAELAEGLVLTPDERKEYEAFKALEVKAADIPGIVTERDEFKKKDAQRSRRDSIAAVVAAEKMPPESVDTIADLGSLSEATWEVKKEKGKDDAGKDVTNDVAYVTLPGQEPVKFSEYRESNAVLKGLRVETEKKEPENRWPIQPTGGKTSVATLEDHRKAVTGQLDYSA